MFWCARSQVGSSPRVTDGIYFLEGDVRCRAQARAIDYKTYKSVYFDNPSYTRKGDGPFSTLSWRIGRCKPGCFVFTTSAKIVFIGTHTFRAIFLHHFPKSYPTSRNAQQISFVHLMRLLTNKTHR